MRYAKDLPCAELQSLYRAGYSTTALGRRYGCSPTTVAKRLRACGALLRPARFRARAIPEALFRELYLQRRLPLAAIAAQLGVGVSTVSSRRRQLGIPPRRGNDAT